VERVCVIGNAGSGKSYVARRLAERLELRYIDFDEAIIGPNWERVPREDRLPLFEELTRDGGWVIDGHLRAGRAWEELILSRSDTVVWLDLPRWRAMASVIGRTLRNVITRKRVWGGNVETWRALFSRDHSVRWGWEMHAALRTEYERLFSDPANRSRTLIRLTSRGAVDRWLATA
jgi:adenylate kinase family enzyme